MMAKVNGEDYELQHRNRSSQLGLDIGQGKVNITSPGNKVILHFDGDGNMIVGPGHWTR